METFEKKLGRLLFLVSRAHYNLASRRFEELGLCRGQPAVLFELGGQEGDDHPGLSQMELAKRLEVKPATMTNLLNRMEKAGLIVRVRDAADARISRIHLTQTGRERLVQSRRVTAQMDQTAFQGFSPAEQDQLNAFFERIHTNLTQSSES